MTGSEIYQQVAAKVGYITNPLMLSVPAPTLPQYVQNIDTIQQKQPSGPTPEQKLAYENTINDLGVKLSPVNYANNTLKDAAMLNENYKFKNQAPIYQKGTMTFQTPEGQVLDVPTAAFQRMAYDQGANGDRLDVLNKYFGSGPPPGMAFSSNAVLQDKLRKFSSNPMLKGQGAINTYDNFDQQANKIQNQFGKNVDLNYAKESLDVQGQGQKGLTGNEKIQQDLNNVPRSNRTSRQTYADRYRQSGFVNTILDEIEQTRPTYSNVPIKETVI